MSRLLVPSFTLILITLVTATITEAKGSSINSGSDALANPDFASPSAEEDVYYEVEDDPQTSSLEMEAQESPSPFTWKQINFISPRQEIGQSRWWYDAPLSFSAKGMDHLYLLNQWLMDLIQPNGIPKEIMTDQLFSDPITVLRDNRNRLLSHFWGMILTATVALCLAVVVPLLGFLLCCCWCDSNPNPKRTRSKSTGRGDSDRRNYPNASHLPRVKSKSRVKREKYHVESGCDSCCRSLFGSIHFSLMLLLSFFVICAFVTNEYIRIGLHDMPRALNQSLDDVQLYLNNTQFEVNTLLRTNFGQLETELGDSLDKSGIILKNRLAFVSQANALDNLTEIVTKLDTIQTDLKVLNQETHELRNALHLLASGLHRMKKDLENVFKECTHQVCTALRNKYRFVLEKFRVSARLDSLPDLEPLMNNITSLLGADIINEVQRGKSAFDRISNKIQLAVNDSIPEIKRQVRAVGEELSETAREINQVLRIPFSDIQRGKEAVAVGGSYITQYEQYRWYISLAASGIIGVILLLYVLGFLNGICSKQPTVNEYRNRRTKPPSTWTLKFGIFLVFFFFGFLMLSTIILFFAGEVSERVGCYYLEHPDEESTKTLMSILQKQLDSMDTSDSMKILHGMKPNVADVLSRCHQNRSLYEALQLNKYNRIQVSGDKIIEGFNVSTILSFKDRYRIEERLAAFLNRVDVNPGPIVILTREGNELLEKLRETSLGTLNFSSFADLVNQRVTPLDLLSVASELDQESNLLPPSQIEHSTSLKNIALMLESYQLKVITKVHHSVERLRAGASKIELKAQYGSKGLKEALTDLVGQAKKAQIFIETKGQQEIRKVAQGFVGDMNSLMDQYTQHVVKEVEESVGRCEPVSRAVNASVMSVCKEVVLPFNGYWLSMGSALVLLLPATITAYILSNLYPKLKGTRGNVTQRQHSPDTDIDTYEDDYFPLTHVVNKNENPNPYVRESRRIGSTSTHLYNAGHSSSHMVEASASAPIADDNWSPGAHAPPHIYTRPPPYNFVS